MPPSAASKIRAGSVWVNAYQVVSPSTPFGRFGLSSSGALQEYLEQKSVFVELTGGTRDPFKLG